MKQPNVVFIISDDQGFWSLGCAGNREIYTPNIDRLAAQGMRFENFSAFRRYAHRRELRC